MIGPAKENGGRGAVHAAAQRACSASFVLKLILVDVKNFDLWMILWESKSLS
jgi:hypothetical protein